MKHIKILFIDDEQGVINAVKNILVDYTVVTEINAFDAIERCKQEEFDIIIVDYWMPVIDGIEVLEEIKEIQKSHDLCTINAANRNSTKSKYTPNTNNRNPVKSGCIRILATASGTTYLFQEELKNNLFSYFLEKPIDAGKLIKLIQKSIGSLNPENNVCQRM